MNMGYTYYKNSDATYGDYGRACIKGGIHGLNPATNFIGTLIVHAPTRYAASMAYGFVAKEMSNYMINRKYNDYIAQPSQYDTLAYSSA